MQLNLSPVKVDVNVENYVIKSDAFYNVCFITEDDLAPRTLEVRTLDDLLKNGYYRFSLAYDFCRTVFLQQGMSSVFVRAKRTNETYEQAFEADDNSTYYYVVIDTKNIETVLSFNTYVNSVDSYKLQLFSSTNDYSDMVANIKIVFYYSPFYSQANTNWVYDNRDVVDWDDTANLVTPLDKDKTLYYINKTYGNNTLPYLSDGVKDYWDWFDDGNVQYDDNSNVTLQVHDLKSVEAQSFKTAYPESGWIALCGHRFPSKIQWLHKFIAGVDDFRLTTIPNLSTTSIRILGGRSTEGSGVTGQGVVINEQVSLDWVRYAITKNVWNLLYQSGKVDATSEGVVLIENKIKEVLDVAVTEGIFSEYRLLGNTLDRQQNNATYKFKAKLTYSILNADIEGVVYN